jgi:hypothetical protein
MTSSLLLYIYVICTNRVYISVYLLAEGGGCFPALDAVTYQASLPGNN